MLGANYGTLGGESKVMGGGSGNSVVDTVDAVLCGGNSNVVTTEWAAVFGTINGQIITVNGVQ